MRSSIQLRKHDNRKNSGGGGWRCQGQLPKKFAIAHIIKPLPPHFWLPPAPFLVQISHLPIIVMFEKLNPHPFIKGPGGGGGGGGAGSNYEDLGWMWFTARIIVSITLSLLFLEICM